MTGEEVALAIRGVLDDTLVKVQREPENVVVRWDPATGVSVEVVWEKQGGEA